MIKKILLAVSLLVSLGITAQEAPYDYRFFTNSSMPGKYFYSSVRVIKPSVVKNQDKKLTISETVFHTPGNALELSFTNNEDGGWEVAIYKPEVRGQDQFNKADCLSFWIYNPSGTTKSNDLPTLALMMKDSTRTNIVQFKTSKIKVWEQVTIPISSFKNVDPGKPGDIIAVVFSQANFQGKRHSIFVDDIEFLPNLEPSVVSNKPKLNEAKGYARHVSLEWQPVEDDAVKFVKIYRAENGKNFLPVGVQYPFINRFADFTGSTGKKYTYKISFLDRAYKEGPMSEQLSAQTRTMTDEELLTMVQEASFQYYWNGAETNSGLAKENIAGRHNMIATGASGFGIMALIVGTERKFITREQSVERFLKIVDFLGKADRFHGVFPHFLDGVTGKVEPFFGNRDNGGDLVEMSFLMQGLLAARAYFNGTDAKEKAIREKITSLWETTEWSWYRQFPDSKFLYWHWSPDQGWVINHKLIGWNETMITYLLAIASPTHPIPASLYYTGWANQDSTGQQYRAGWGGTTEGSMYTNGNTYFDVKLDVGVSTGGPLFFIHYSYLGYDPHLVSDRYTNYFTNNQNIAKINYRYCVSNPGNYKGYGDSCWGLTASDGPFNYAADEPVMGRETGKIAPTGAISSFPYLPVESMKALKNYYYNYGKFLWGEYGFRDAFNLTENWCSGIYMGLNQAPMTVMIENYRTGLLWKLFMSDKDVQAGLAKLAAETQK